jgi:hypothetical protein
MGDFSVFRALKSCRSFVCTEKTPNALVLHDFHELEGDYRVSRPRPLLKILVWRDLIFVFFLILFDKFIQDFNMKFCSRPWSAFRVEIISIF